MKRGGVHNHMSNVAGAKIAALPGKKGHNTIVVI